MACLLIRLLDDEIVQTQGCSEGVDFEKERFDVGFCFFGYLHCARHVCVCVLSLVLAVQVRVRSVHFASSCRLFDGLLAWP